MDVTLRPELVRPRVAYLSHATGLYDDLTAVENLRFAAAMRGLSDAADAVACGAGGGWPDGRRRPARAWLLGRHAPPPGTRAAAAWRLVAGPAGRAARSPRRRWDGAGRSADGPVARRRRDRARGLSPGGAGDAAWRMAGRAGRRAAGREPAATGVSAQASAASGLVAPVDAHERPARRCGRCLADRPQGRPGGAARPPGGRLDALLRGAGAAAVRLRPRPRFAYA